MKVVIAHPDAEVSKELQNLIHVYEDTLETVRVEKLDLALMHLQECHEGAILLTEVFWDQIDMSETLLLTSLDYPEVSVGIVSSYDLTTVIPDYYPLPRISGIDDTDAIAQLYVSLREDLRHQQFGNYQITHFSGQGFLGRMYKAYHTALKRNVNLTFSPVNADPAVIERFQATSSARAGNIHPSIYAIYEETQVDHRLLIAAEPRSGPTLLQLYAQGQLLDDRQCARILHTVGTGLIHLQQYQISHRPLQPYDVTLDSNGVIKLLNTALPSDEPMPSIEAETYTLYQHLLKMIDHQASHEPRLIELFNQMEEGTIDLPSIITTAKQIDVDLAPVVAVPQRTSQTIASEEIQKARKTNLYIIIGICIVSAISLTTILILSLNQVVVEPMTDFRDQIEIPAGTVKVNKTDEVKVNTFYMDKYEITIGQYDLFLKDMEGVRINNYLPPDYPYSKSDFVPKNWEEILISVQKKKKVFGEILTWDSPIMFIDYADAYAYAKWAGKRLPTQAEWIRAASGNDHLKLPWGNTPEISWANTGRDLKTSDDVPAGGIDGFRGPAPVNALRKDKSPFGVIGLAGNVCEWVSLIPENTTEEENYGFVHGSSWYMNVLIINRKPYELRLRQKEPWVGLRCVSDRPVE
ncbi:MAG: SUMF1/EgtB/PvdO family nonheme iron enzyme [Verrucomicrobiota bacterium]